MTKNYYAVIAGLCASSASFFGKLPSTLTEQHVKINSTEHPTIFGIFEQNTWTIHIICFSLMVICNAMVWTFFVKALHDKGGSLVATVSSAATNYCFSAFLGCLIFKETTSAFWWIGTALVLSGLVLIVLDNDNVNTKDEIKKLS